MIVITGGRTGAGATTVAVNLAAALADRGQRVLLVDAAEQRPLVAEAAGVQSAVDKSLSDILAGNCAAADAIIPGPAGSMMLTNRWSGNSGKCFSRQAQQRLLSELQSLGGKVDLLLVEIGSGLTPWTRRFWLRAQLVLLVTTTDGAALIDSYAAVKRSVADALGPDTRLLVNQCDNDRLAAEAHRRFANACQRFLGRTVPALPPLPRHAHREDASKASFPRVWEAPDTPFGHAVLWLGRAVSDLLSTPIVTPTARAPFEQQLVA